MADNSEFDSTIYFEGKAVKADSGNVLLNSAAKLREEARIIANEIGLAKAGQAELIKQTKLRKETWVDQAGLTPDSAMGQIVNKAAGAVSGLAKGVAFVGALPTDIASVLMESQVTPEQWDAYNRLTLSKVKDFSSETLGPYTEEDKRLLASHRSMSEEYLKAHPEIAARIKAKPESYPTVLDEINRAKELRAEGRKLSEKLDFGNIVDQRDKQGFNKALDTDETKYAVNSVQAGWGKVKDGNAAAGIAEMAPHVGSLILAAAETAAKNPSGTLDYVAENLPQMVVGAFGKVGKGIMTMFNSGYAIDNYQKGIDNYKEFNEGEMPPVELRKEMAKNAALAGFAEQAGDVLALRGLRKAFSEPAEDATKTLRSSSTGAVKQTGIGFLNEGLTEGAQTYLEGQAQLKPATPMEIFQGAAIGAASGGAISAGFGSLDVSATGASALASKVSDSFSGFGPKDKAANPAADEALKTKNVDGLLNPKEGSFNPSAAISVLHKLASDETASAEEKLGYQQKAQEAISLLQRNVGVLRGNTSAGLDSLKADLGDLKAELASTSPSDTATVESLQEYIGVMEAVIKDSEAAQAKDPQAEGKLKAAETSLAEAEILYKSMMQGSSQAASKTDVLALVAEANQPDRVQAESAVQKALILSMVSPGVFTSSQAQELADNTSNALTPTERKYLNAYAAAARAVEGLKGLSRVNTEVLDGDPARSQKGLLTYQERFGGFASSNDVLGASRELKGLGKFLEGHKSKAVAMRDALAASKTEGKRMKVSRVSVGNWKASETAQSDQEIRDSGDIVIDQRSQALVRSVWLEAQAIAKTHRALSAAFDLRFNKKPESNASGNQAQQPADLGSAQAEASTGTQTQAAPDSGADAGTNTSPQPSTSSDAVEAYGVVEAQETQDAQEAQSEEGTALVDQGSGVGGDVQSRAEEQPATPKTDEATAIEKALDQAGKAYRRLVRNNPHSLYSAVKHKLIDSDLFDIYGNEWKKRYTALKGKNGRSLVSMVSAGELDAFLPANLRFGQGIASGLDAELEAVEYIKDSLRNGNYLTDETNNALAQLSVTIEQLEAALSTQDIIDEIAQTVQQISADQVDGTDQDSRDSGEATTGSSDGNAGTQADASAFAEGSSDSQADQVIEAVEAVEEAPADGKLAALDRSSPDNKIAAWLKQSVGNAEAASRRPLVAVKDFLTSWATKKTSPTKFVKDDLTEEQKNTLRSFFKFAAEFKKTLPDVLARNKNPDYAHLNPAEYLMSMVDGKLNMEENVVVGMAMASMTKLADMVTLGLENNDEAINSILGKGKDEIVSPEARKELGYNMVRRAVFADALGKQIVSALGFKAESGAPSSLLPNLEASIGTYAMEVLARKKLITYKSIDGALFKKLTGSKKSDVYAEQVFVQIAANTKTRQISSGVKSLVDSVKGSKNVLEKLFSVESGTVAPTMEAVPFTQAKAKDSKMGVPSWLAERLDKMNRVENKVNQDVFRVVAQMLETSPELVDQMAGVQEIDPATAHAANIPGIQAKNDGLRREVQNFMAFVSDTVLPSGGLNVPFFFQHEVWKNQRVGISNNLVNPQTSKVHRYLITRNSWATELDLNNADEVQNFKLRVLEGFGVKTEKDTKEKVLEAWDAKVNTDVIKAGVAALQVSLQGGTLSVAQSTAVANAVAQAKEKFHSLNALVALAKYEAAKANGEASVSVTLTGEVDGVTNGPMLTHLLLGAANSVPGLMALLNKGGFFEESSAFENFGPYRGSEGVMDLYETVASKIIQQVAESKAPPALLNAIWSFTGKLEKGGKVDKPGRDIVKTPITALMFGSATQKAVGGMADNFIESIYSAMEDAAKGKRDPAEVVAQLNVLLGRKLAWPSAMSAANMLKSEFNADEISTIKRVFNEGLGDIAANVMEVEFAAVLERRKHINQSAKMLFGIYDSAYTRLREKTLFDLAQEGKIPVNGVGKPLWDLTKEQEQDIRKKLRPMEPMMHSVMSLRSGNLGSGLAMAKTETALSTDPLYNNTVQLKGAATKTISVNAETLITKDPGVALVPGSAHSTDSGISHEAAPKTEALNIHDAHVAGLGEFLQVAKNLNSATWNSMVEYSPMAEMAEAMQRTVLGMAKVMQDPEIAAAIASPIKDFLARQMQAEKVKTTSQEYLLGKLGNAQYQAYVADSIRLGALASMKAIDQYAMEGGQHMVTQAQRDDAKARLDALTMTLPDQVVDKVLALGNALQTPMVKQDAQSAGQQSEASKALEALKLSTSQAQRLMRLLTGLDSTPTDLKKSMDAVLARMESSESSLAVAANDSLSDVQTLALVQYLSAQIQAGVVTSLGTVGKSQIPSSPKLVEMLEAQPEMTGKELIKKLSQYLGTLPDNPTAVFYRKLLSMAYRSIHDDVKVVYITSDTDPNTINKPGVPSRGWYLPGIRTLHILGNDFVNSAVNSEVLSHELVHAALFNIVEFPSNPQQEQIVKELHTLMDEAKAFIAMNNVKVNLESGVVSNIHEFIAYGMTSREFQTKVLAKMKVPTPKGQFITAMQDFINKLVGLLFNKTFDSTAEEVDGFTALLVNVTGLYQEAANQEKANQEQKANDANMMFSMASQPVVDPVVDFTTEEVFAGLDGHTNSGAFTQKLASLLDDVVTKLHGPFGILKTKAEQAMGKTALDVWTHLQTTNQLPFASKVLNAGLRFSQKEAYVAEQVEATMIAALDKRSSPNSAVYRELEKLYTQASKALKGKIDADLYSFVFQPTLNSNGRSEYLSRFVAISLANEEFNKAMSFTTSVPDLNMQGKAFMERLEAVWRVATDWLGSKLTGTYMGQAANDKVGTLVNQLVQVEARYKDGISAKKGIFELLDPVDEKASTAIDKVKQGIAKIAGSDFVKNSRFVPLQVVGTVAKIYAEDRVKSIVEGMNRVRDANHATATGTAMGLVNYVNGIQQWANALLLASKQVDKNRLAVTYDTAGAALASFENGGEDLTSEQKEAVSAVLLRTGMHFLLDNYSMQAIQDLLQNKAALDAAIDAELANLSGFANEVDYYTLQAKGLGYYAATGEVAVDRQMLNAANISKLSGTGRKAPANAKQAEAVLERLVTLYSLRYSDSAKMSTAADLMRQEGQRGTENGAEVVLKLHKHLHVQAKERMFEGSEALMVHGYTPEILNQKTTFQVARDDKEAQALVEQGYVLHSEVSQDKADPDNRPASLYVLRGGGLGRRLTGMFSFTDLGTKGASKHNQFYAQNSVQGRNNARSMAAIMGATQQAVNSQFRPQPNFDPALARKLNGNKLLPTVNADGQIVDFRYVMSHKTKDTLLQRDNRFEHVLGTMAGSTYDKEASKSQNRKVLKALKDHYDSEFSDNPLGFVLVHSTSTDPEMREIWDMLPSTAKKDAIEVWGGNGVWVPKSMVKAIFGYRKFSLADVYDKEKPNQVEQAFMDGVAYILKMYAISVKGMTGTEAANYSKRGKVVVRNAEEIWQEFVHAAKDFIVVKTGTVLVGNFLSNAGMLAMKGVPLIKAIRYQHEALKGVMDYERDRYALAQLQLLVDAGYGSRSMDEVQAEIVILKDKIVRNPVKKLIDAGLMPTIVEDISMEDSPYSFKSQLTHWMDEKADSLNPHVVKAGKFVYMSHDTLLYKTLSGATRYSDFMARYALHKHQTTRAENPLSDADAIYEASEAFVNYDLPLPKSVQYLDDMGFLPFIKYFLSIQRVLAQNFKEAPLRVMSVAAMNGLFADLPMPTDSSFLVRVGNNPFGVGALGYPMDVTQAMTMQGAASLVK